MTVFQSIMLGFLQGITEFLPVSSSGHLAVAQKLFNLDDIPLLFDVMLHLATLLAVCLYFRKKIARLFACLWRWIFRKPMIEKSQVEKVDQNDLLSGTDFLGRKTIVAVIVATFVTGVIGVFTSKLIPELPIKYTCVGFLITALLLVFSSIWEKKNSGEIEKKSFSEHGISVIQALFIGFMQGVGTLPGISRSGSTIAGANLSGVERSASGEFSFIISIPAILGAFILEAKDLGKISSSIGALPVLCGCVAAFTWGYIALSLLMKMIRRGKLEWFACYLVPLGIFGLIFF